MCEKKGANSRFSGSSPGGRKPEFLASGSTYCSTVVMGKADCVLFAPVGPASTSWVWPGAPIDNTNTASTSANRKREKVSGSAAYQRLLET